MRGLQEVIGVAVQASNLAATEDQERAVDRIGGLGAAQLAQGRIGGIDLGESRAIAALLWRAKFGGDARSALPAASRLAYALSSRSQARRWRAGTDLLHRIAGRVIGEWLEDRCPTCRGVGRLAFDDQGRRLHVVPRGTPTRQCQPCRGTGRRRWTDTDRALALGLPVDVYRRRWAVRFEEVEREFAKVVGCVARPLREQLERDRLQIR